MAVVGEGRCVVFVVGAAGIDLIGASGGGGNSGSSGNHNNNPHSEDNMKERIWNVLCTYSPAHI